MLSNSGFFAPISINSHEWHKEHPLLEEGTNQGCFLAIDFYGIGTMNLIYIRKEIVWDCKNMWYANDLAGAGKVNDVKL